MTALLEYFNLQCNIDVGLVWVLVIPLFPRGCCLSIEIISTPLERVWSYVHSVFVLKNQQLLSEKPSASVDTTRLKNVLVQYLVPLTLKCTARCTIFIMNTLSLDHSTQTTINIVKPYKYSELAIDRTENFSD